MRGDLLLVLLLGTGLTAGVAQTDKKPGTEHAAGAAKTQKKEAQAKTEAPQAETAEAPAKKPPEATDSAQVKTEAEQKEAQEQTDKDPKLKSVPGGQALGMSILGNEETPTSLVIVPWKIRKCSCGSCAITRSGQKRSRELAVYSPRNCFLKQ